VEVPEYNSRLLLNRGPQMMKTVVLVLIVSATAIAQEHAPTVEQCRADAAVWSAKDADIKTRSMKELWARCHEMNQCTKVDRPESDYFFKYLSVCNETNQEYESRVIDFLNRHHANWKEEFDAEDAVGKR
jgi:hypothetical protein